MPQVEEGGLGRGGMTLLEKPACPDSWVVLPSGARSGECLVTVGWGNETECLLQAGLGRGRWCPMVPVA